MAVLLFWGKLQSTPDKCLKLIIDNPLCEK